MNFLQRSYLPAITAFLSIVSIASISTIRAQDSATDFMALIEQAQDNSDADYADSTLLELLDEINAPLHHLDRQ